MDDIHDQTRIVDAEAAKKYMSSPDGKIPSHSSEMIELLEQMCGDVAILIFQYHSKIDTMPGPPSKATSVYHLMTVPGRLYMPTGHM